MLLHSFISIKIKIVIINQFSSVSSELFTFIYNLFIDAIDSAHYTASDGRIIC